MKLVMHLGDGKCGSTAIQMALHQQRKELRSAGILYDTGPARKDHFLLTTLLGRVTRSASPGQSDYARTNLESLAAQAGDYTHILLSSEALLSNDPGEVLRLLDKCGIRPSSVHAIAYVRPPYSMYPSLIQQQLKGNSRFTMPSEYKRPIHKFVGAWQDALGSDHVTVRLFDRDSLVEHDIVADFAAILRGLVGGTLPELTGHETNMSLSAEQLVVLQELRRGLPLEAQGKFQPESNRLISVFQIINSGGLIGSKIKLSRDARAAVDLNNRDVVAEVNRLVPGLDMGAELGDDVKGELSSAKWQGGCSVAEVLGCVDGDLVSLLSAIFLRPTAEESAARTLFSAYGIDGLRREAIVRGLERWGVEL